MIERMRMSCDCIICGQGMSRSEPQRTPSMLKSGRLRRCSMLMSDFGSSKLRISSTLGLNIPLYKAILLFVLRY